MGILRIFSRILKNPIRRLADKIRNQKFKLNLKTGLIIGINLIVIIVGIIILKQVTGGKATEWYNDNWTYRTPYTLSNGGAADTNKRIKIDIDTATLTTDKLQADCGDSRFVDSTGKLLKYFIDTAGGACDGASTDYWILLPNIIAGTSSIFHYYGNPTATNRTEGSQFSESELGSYLATAGTETVGPPPIAYWKFDEGTGTTTQDATSNNNDATLGSGTSAPTWQTENICISDNCLYFDGTNDKVSIGTTVPSIKSVSFWVRPNTSTEYFIDINGTANIQSSGGIVSGTGFTSPTIYVDGRESTTITANTWHYITVTTATGLTGSGMTIGKISTNFLQGFMDEVKLYPYVRSAAEIKQDFSSRGSVHGVSAQFGDDDLSRKLSSGLVGYYKMDEATGSTGPSWTVLDSSGNGYNRTGVGNAGTTAPGKFGNAGTFDGTGDYVSIASGGAGTISFSNLGTSADPDINNGSNLTAYSAPSWTPPTSGLIIVFVHNKGNSEGEAVPPTVTGNGLTWVQIATLNHPSTADIVTLFGANASGSSTGVTTFDFGVNLQLNLNAQFFLATGVDLSGTVASAFVQSPTGSGSAVSGTVPLNSAASSGNRPIAGFMHLANEGTSERANWTEVDDNSGVGPARGIETQWRSDAFETTASGTWPTSANWSGIAAELKVETTSASEIDNVDKFTLSTWVNPSSSIATKALLVRNNEIRLVTDASGNPICQIHNGTDWQTAATSSTALSLGSWQHVGCTYDQKTLRVFVNGVQTGSQALTEPVANSANGWKFGNDAGGTYGDYNGRMDEVRIYNRAFSPREVSQLYEFAPGPVGYWTMDDGVSGDSQTIKDISGNGNNGTTSDGANNSGMNCTVQGKFGKGCGFDGADDYVNAGDPTSGVLDFDTGSLTISVWIKPESFDDTSFIVMKKSTTGVAAGYSLRLGVTTGPIAVNIGDSTNNVYGSTGIAPDLNQWNHLVMVYDRTANNAYLYLNGILRYTADIATVTGSTSNSDDFLIGRAGGGGGSYFDGLIDDVKIYNYARTQKQIIQDMNAGHPAVGTPVGSTVLHLKMDEGYGSAAHDISPQGNDGILATGSSAPTWTNDGKFGKALSFDGSDDYAKVAHTSSIDFGSTASFSLSLWINTASDTSGGNRTIIEKRNGASGAMIRIEHVNSTNKARCNLYDGTNNPNTSSLTSLPVGSWLHYVCVVNQDTGRIQTYVNGKNETDISDSSLGSVSNSGAWLIGKGNDQSKFHGSLDELKIYPFALTSDEVKVEYNQGKSIVLGALSTGVGGTGVNFSAGREYCIPGDSTTCNAPVGEWNFNEGVGSTAFDTSTSGNVGNFNSSPDWTAGKSSKGLYFDGSSDFVTMGDVSALQITGDLTYSAWIKPSQVGVADKVIAKWKDAAPAAYAYLLQTAASNIFSCYSNDGSSPRSASSTSTFTAGKWYFVSCVRSNKDLIIYVNGVKEDTQNYAASTWVSAAAPFKVGAGGSDTGAESAFTGMVDQVKVYNYARTQAQVAWEYNRGAPVAWYRMDECQGTTAYNAVVNGDRKAAGNNGTIYPGSSGNTAVGTCTSGTSTHMWYNGTTGRHGASLGFDGSDDYVEISDMSFTNNQTVSMWIKPGTTINSGSGRKDLWYAGENYLIINYTSDGKLSWFVYADAGLREVESTTTSWTADTWYHLMGTYDGSTLRLYINGVLQNTTSYSGSVTANVYNPEIGSSNNGTENRFNGLIDEVKIYNYALTHAQVKTVMNEGAVRFE